MSKTKKKPQIPSDPRARTWESLERQLYSPERIKKNHAAGDRLVAQQQLRELRERRGLTQVQLAKKMGITQATLSELENRGDARISTIKALAEALGGKLRLVIDFGDEPVIIGLGE